MLIYGVINNVKGIKEAIYSLLQYNQIQNLSILIVGKQDSIIKKFLNNKNIKNLIYNRKIIVVDNFVDEKQKEKYLQCQILDGLVMFMALKVAVDF